MFYLIDENDKYTRQETNLSSYTDKINEVSRGKITTVRRVLSSTLNVLVTFELQSMTETYSTEDYEKYKELDNALVAAIEKLNDPNIHMMPALEILEQLRAQTNITAREYDLM